MQTFAGQRSAAEAKCIIWKEVRESNSVCVLIAFYPTKHYWVNTFCPLKLFEALIWFLLKVLFCQWASSQDSITNTCECVCVDGLLGAVTANKHYTLCMHSGGSVWLVSGVCVCAWLLCVSDTSVTNLKMKSACPTGQHENKVIAIKLLQRSALWEFIARPPLQVLSSGTMV